MSHEDRSIFVTVFYMKPANIHDLVRKVGLCRQPTVAACRRLVKAEWLRLEPHGRHLKPVCWIPHSQQEVLVAELERDYDMAPLGGEFLMGRLSEFWVDHPRVIPNARPDFLENPQTKERFEIDRYFEGLAGFEYMGVQHYRETSKYTREQVDEIKARDLMKEGMCKKAGIPLVAMKHANLSIEGMKQLLPPHLPQVPILHFLPRAEELRCRNCK